MPNWCNNTLEVSGRGSSLYKFYSENIGEEGDLSFQRAIPMPPNLPRAGAWHDWLGWATSNWGTKWDIDDPGTECTALCENFCSGTMTYVFDTAWSPPEPWLAYVAGDYPDLCFTLKYVEEGMGFRGTLVIEHGKVTFEQTEDIEYDEDGEIVDGEI